MLRACWPRYRSPRPGARGAKVPGVRGVCGVVGAWGTPGGGAPGAGCAGASVGAKRQTTRARLTVLRDNCFTDSLGQFASNKAFSLFSRTAVKEKGRLFHMFWNSCAELNRHKRRL